MFIRIIKDKLKLDNLLCQSTFKLRC